MEAITSLGALWILFLLVLGILWFLLPFAIFGTKDRLRDLIEESRRSNQELVAIRKQLSDLQQTLKDK